MVTRSPAPVRHPAFDRPMMWSDARRRGVPVRTLAKARPDSAVPTVRVPAHLEPGTHPAVESWAMAAALVRAIEGAQINRLTAAMRHGLRLPQRLSTRASVHLNRSPGQARIRRRGVGSTQFVYHPDDLMEIDDCAVTTPLRTLVDLVPLLTEEEFVIAADGVVNEHSEG